MLAAYLTKAKEKISILNEKCLAAYDISEIFNDVDKPIYITMGHMSDFGNNIVADEIFRLTKPYLVNELSINPNLIN